MNETAQIMWFQPTSLTSYLSSKIGPPPHSSLAVTFNLEYEWNGSKKFFFFSTCTWVLQKRCLQTSKGQVYWHFTFTTEATKFSFHPTCVSGKPMQTPNYEGRITTQRQELGEKTKTQFEQEKIQTETAVLFVCFFLGWLIYCNLN